MPGILKDHINKGFRTHGMAPADTRTGRYYDVEFSEKSWITIESPGINFNPAITYTRGCKIIDELVGKIEQVSKLTSKPFKPRR